MEEHSVYVEVELEVSCEAYKKQEINLIQDLYSPKSNILFTQKQINIMEKREYKVATCNIREKQVIPEIGSNKIYDAEVEINITKQTVLKDRILFEGEANLNYIFSEENQIGTKKTVIPFNFNMDFEGVNTNSDISANVEVGTKDFIITSAGEIEAKLDINFNVTSTNTVLVNIIDDISEEENRGESTCSLVIYYAKEGDTIWKIAKTFKSTVDEITRINGIENENKLDIGKQLFIPRYNG